MISRERLGRPGWKILGLLFLVAVIMAGGWGARAAAREMAKAILANGPVACRYVLEAIHRGLEMPLAEGLVLEATLFGLCAATEDTKEGMNAFLAGRPPNFQKFRVRAKKELAQYVDGYGRDLNAPPAMRGKKAKQD